MQYPSLLSDLETEAVVIGGGFTGIFTAYMLAKAGIRVVILESGRIGGGASAFTTAFITQVIDMSLIEMTGLFGAEEAQKIWASGAQAIEMFEEIIKAEQIECEFQRCPLYLYSTNHRALANFKAENALAQAFGFKTRVSNDGALGFANKGYLEIPVQAKFHPIKFIEALAVKAQALGVQIFEGSEVIEISGDKLEVRTATVQVIAKDIIVATHSPIVRPKILASQKAKYKSYVIEASIPKGVLPEAMFVDSKNPYHYVRVDARDKYDRLIVGGSDHRQDFPVNEKRCYKALERYISTLIPGTPFTVRRQWSGPLIESVDGLPYIGEYAPNRFVATGFSGNGMTYSLISAQIFRDRILGQKNQFAGLYDPKRKQTWKQILTNARHYIGLFLGGAVKNTL